MSNILIASSGPIEGPSNLSEFLSLSREQLIILADRRSAGPDNTWAFFADQVLRIDQELQTRRMVSLTWAIAAMTLVMTIATVVNVVIFIQKG